MSEFDLNAGASGDVGKLSMLYNENAKQIAHFCRPRMFFNNRMVSVIITSFFVFMMFGCIISMRKFGGSWYKVGKNAPALGADRGQNAQFRFGKSAFDRSQQDTNLDLNGQQSSRGFMATSQVPLTGQNQAGFPANMNIQGEPQVSVYQETELARREVNNLDNGIL